LAVQPDFAAGNQAQGIGVDAMLDREDARRKRIRRIVIAYRDRTLHHDWTCIGFRNNKMDGRAGDFHPRPQRLTRRIDAGK